VSEVFSIQISKHGTDRHVWLALPATPEQVQAAMGQIGVTRDNPWDYTVSGFSTPESRHLAIPYDMAIASGINELNFLAARLEKLDAYEIATLNAALQEPKSELRTMGRIIDYADNLDYYVNLPDVRTAAQLGEYYLCESRVETEQKKSSSQAAEDMEKQARKRADLGSELYSSVVIQPVKETLNGLTAHTYKSRKSVSRANGVPSTLFAWSANLNVTFSMQHLCPFIVYVGFVGVKSTTGNWANIPHDLLGSSQIVLWGRSNHQCLGQGKPAGITLGKSMKFYPIIILVSGRIVAFSAYS